MTRGIDKVAVLGAGTMGAGIAAHCAAKGVRVLLLDMPAAEGGRNAIAEAAKARMLEGRAPLLDEPAQAELVETGNFDDDLGRLAEADLIIEAIVEDLAAKRALFARLEPARCPGSIVATNTSGIPLGAIAAGMPERLRQDIAVTHFFNPVKVMKLVELVPGEDTRPEVLADLEAFLGRRLEKGVVRAKDTVNFIANRIGCFWLLAGLAEANGLAVEEVDAAMSAPVGVPSTGLYGLVDLVGLDVLALVAANLAENLPADDPGRAYLSLPAPVRAMRERGQIGRKSGGGFYRLRQAEDGGRLRETFDLGSESWRPSRPVELPAAERSLDGLLFSDSAIGRFAWKTMGGTLLYAARLVPEISDGIVGVDRAMRWGFAWRQGPFEMLDALGAERVLARLDAEGRPAPGMLEVLRREGGGAFYADGRALAPDGSRRPVD